MQSAIELGDQLLDLWNWEGAPVRGSREYDKGIMLIRARDKEIVADIIRIFDSHASWNPHGVDNPDGSRNGIIHCNDALRAELDKYKADLEG